MRKLFFLLLLFVYLPAKSQGISLPYFDNALIQYVKPYIYIIERDNYRTVKVPEMTTSEPVFFQHLDTSFLKKFEPRTYELCQVNKGLFLTHNLGGNVLELRGNQLIRVDKSYEHKMQINSSVFIYDNRIFRFGGYGFWSARNFFTYFDLNSKEWEAYTPVQGEKIPPGLLDINTFKSGNNVTLFNGVTIDKLDPLKFEKNSAVWAFDLKTKTWNYRGDANLYFGNNPQNFQYQNYYVAFTEERRIIRVNFKDDSYEIFTNEAISTKISPLFKPFVEGDYLYFFANNHPTKGIDLTRVRLRDFLGEPLSKHDFIQLNIFVEYQSSLFAGSALLIILVLIAYILYFRSPKTSKITDKSGQLYLGNAAINFDGNELKVLKYLLKFNDVPNSELLGLVEQKGVHFSHNIRVKNDVLNQLNLKLKAILQVDTNFIIFKKSDTDSRLKVYRLNKHYFQVSMDFLND
jgi:hypothetical protein